MPIYMQWSDDLRLSTLKGSASDAGHKGWIEVAALRWPDRVIRDNEKVAHDRRVIIDATTAVTIEIDDPLVQALLFAIADSGAPARAVIEVINSQSGQVMRYTLTKAVITQAVVSHGGSVSVTVSYEKLDRIDATPLQQQTRNNNARPLGLNRQY